LLQQKKNNLQQELNNRYAEVSAARDAFIAETDGTGGSKKIGLKDIAQAKQREYEKLDADYKLKEQEYQPQTQSTDSALIAMMLPYRKNRQLLKLY
jgi:hypothetical protein